MVRSKQSAAAATKSSKKTIKLAYAQPYCIKPTKGKDKGKSITRVKVRHIIFDDDANALIDPSTGEPKESNEFYSPSLGTFRTHVRLIRAIHRHMGDAADAYIDSLIADGEAVDGLPWQETEPAEPAKPAKPNTFKFG